MSERWHKAVEEGADALGERLVEQVEGEAEYSYEDVAAATLAAGLAALLRDGPEGARLEAAAAAIHGRLHDAEQAPWAGLETMERDFWLSVARDALTAADRSLLRAAGAGNAAD